MTKHTVELGDKVRCLATGFTGIATAITTYINGCDRVTVSPPVGKDNKMPEAYYIDVTGLEVVKKQVLTPPALKANTGGPSERVKYR